MLVIMLSESIPLNLKYIILLVWLGLPDLCLETGSKDRLLLITQLQKQVLIFGNVNVSLPSQS